MTAPSFPVESVETPRPRVPMTVSTVLRPYITAAAALDAANGVAGTLDATPTAAECSALMIHGTWDVDLDIREVEVSMTSHTGKACSNARLTLNPGDAIIAADRLVSATQSTRTVRPGDEYVVPTNAAVTDAYIVWQFAGGTGYSDVELEVFGVSYA